MNGPELHPHQRDVVLRVAHPSVHGLVVWHPTGSGKTVTAAAAARELRRAGAVDRVLIAAPKSVLSHHELHAADVADEVMTHEAFARRRDDPCDARTLLVVDEAHRLRGYDRHAGRAVRTKAFLAAARQAVDVIA